MWRCKCGMHEESEPLPERCGGQRGHAWRAHPKHQMRACDLGRVEGQRLVKRRCPLPTPNEGTHKRCSRERCRPAVAAGGHVGARKTCTACS